MCSGNGCGRAGLPARQQAAFHDRDRFTASEPGKSVAIMAPDRADALAASQFGHDNMLSAVPLGLHAEIVIQTGQSGALYLAPWAPSPIKPEQAT
jgi:hypothetical protein